MGATFYDLTCEELCELMCGKPDDEGDDIKNQEDFIKENSDGKGQ